ncbi:uncharacterized protein LAJ45_04742 [Morchella importuna]|uniref:uncharacterized protein n=1 Tax=Morchella importuna TaxID=1174673 RepID=UPI001E8E3AFE|nr:uncharacterized protein LAJ45_04742 [Morchella importuna]KAH8151041.1 hypothetical protein LAJ45_04742 [Morchella importuna]
MPYILAPTMRSLSPDQDTTDEDNGKRLWSYNLDNLLRQKGLKQYIRSIYRCIASKIGYGIPLSKRLQIYINKAQENPDQKVALLIQLVEGSTLEAENLLPMIQPLQQLRFRHHIHGFLSTKDETQMFELLNAGDKLVESVAEVHDKVLAELIGGVHLRRDQVTQMRRLWLDVELRVEEFLTEKYLLLAKFKGVTIISSQVHPLVKILFLTILACLIISLGFMIIPTAREAMLDGGEGWVV